VLIELAESWLTPCPWHLRRMGYLHEVLGIRGRYLRCRSAWRSHLEHSQDIIRQAMGRCNTRRAAAVVGSGLLLDVPLADLAREFERVYLVDLIHPLGVRWRVRRYANVRLVPADVTNAARAVCEAADDHSGPLPRPEATLPPEAAEADLVVSLNLLSQLPYIPTTYLRRVSHRPAAEIEALGRHLIEAHLRLLQGLPGVVCLIADFESLAIDAAGRLDDVADTLYGVRLPSKGEEWVWELAPRPEACPEFSYHRRVIGIPDLRATSLCPPSLTVQAPSQCPPVTP
jgi:hypothetical protein